VQFCAVGRHRGEWDEVISVHTGVVVEFVRWFKRMGRRRAALRVASVLTAIASHAKGAFDPRVDFARALQVASGSPTPLPTKAPTTQTPTTSPTVPRDLCAPGEWLPEDFDANIATCGITECAAEAALNNGEDIEVCMADCMKNLLSLSASCAFCIGRYADCMLEQCECFGGRGQSDACEKCSSDFCEPPLNNCSGSVFLLPFQDDVEELSESLLIFIGAISGGIALLVGILIVVASKQRRRRQQERKDIFTSIEHNDNEVLDAIATSSAEFINPLTQNGTTSGRPPIPASRDGPAAPIGPGFKHNEAPVPPPSRTRPMSLKATDPRLELARAAGRASTKIDPDRIRTVAFQFDADEDDELSCKESEKVFLVDRVDQNWWWARKMSNGEEGLLPDNTLAE